MDRIAMLNEILAQAPNDPFARYGLAMEYSKVGDAQRALGEFGKLLAAHHDYTSGYFMAQRTRNAHAQSEMEAMLTELA
jgi:cytochrome c-type biogenesis protein CcmH/NrfG